jgi:hypothetical protein
MPCRAEKALLSATVLGPKPYTLNPGRGPTSGGVMLLAQVPVHIGVAEAL